MPVTALQDGTDSTEAMVGGLCGLGLGPLGPATTAGALLPPPPKKKHGVV